MTINRFDSILLVIFLIVVHVIGIPTTKLNHEHEFALGSTLNETENSLLKRDLTFRCTHQTMKPLLIKSLNDAELIVGNAVKSLDLILSLYKDDDSGELRDNKSHKNGRTFDEENAFESYAMFVYRHYHGQGHPQNKAGLEAVKYTREIANTMHSQLVIYQTGAHDENFPHASLYCNEDEYVSEVCEDNGLTYTEDLGFSNPFPENGEMWYMLCGRAGKFHTGVETPDDEQGYNWVAFTDICGEQPEDSHRTFGSLSVPVNPKMMAYQKSAELTEETITFCPVFFPQWIEKEKSSSRKMIHYRNMHVEMGGSLSDMHRLSIKKLFKEGEEEGIDAHYLRQFVVQTMIHEFSHAESFTPPGKQLEDIECAPNQTTQYLHCLKDIAAGIRGLDEEGRPQGHKDADAFAMFCMVMWSNSVTWYADYRPVDSRE